MKKQLSAIKRFGRRYRLVISIIAISTLATLGGLTWYTANANQQISKVNENTKQITLRAEAIAKETEEKRAAEEEKLRQEALAKAAAEASRRSGAAGATSIDSSKCNVSKTRNNPASIDVLVNKKHCIQPLGYAPSDLTTIYGATLSVKASDAFKRMYEAAAAAGQGFSVTSSYRSYSHQVSTYNRWVSISGQAGADTYSARPGYSEHQTGFVIDVAAGSCTLDCFGSTSQYQWFQAHAAEYGFIQRYYAGYDAITGYKAEEWHYRYVGVDVAQDMKQKGVKTLEQYWNMPGGTY